MQRHVAETVGELDTLSHSLNFWIDLIGMEERSDCTLVIPLLGLLEKKLLGFIEYETASWYRAGQLLVREVESVDIDDGANVGTYDIAEFYFDQTRSAVVLRSGVPLVLTVLVKRLHVVLELD